MGSTEEELKTLTQVCNVQQETLELQSTRIDSVEAMALELDGLLECLRKTSNSLNRRISFFEQRDAEGCHRTGPGHD